jgi:hypothetical protein
VLTARARGRGRCRSAGAEPRVEWINPSRGGVAGFGGGFGVGDGPLFSGWVRIPRPACVCV